MSIGIVLRNDEVLWFRGGNLSRILAWTITEFELNELERESIQSAFHGLDFVETNDTPDLLRKIRITCKSILDGNAQEINWPKIKGAFTGGPLSYEPQVLDIDRKSAKRIMSFLDKNEPSS